MLHRPPLSVLTNLRCRLLLVGLAAALALGLAAIAGVLWMSRSASTPGFAHIWLIVMENRDYGQVIGSSDSPYTNQLASTYGLATQYYAVTHGSQPNYIALFSGAEYGVTGGSTPNLRSNLADQIEGTHRTWRVFAETFQAIASTGIQPPVAAMGPARMSVGTSRPSPSATSAKLPQRCANVTDFSHFDPAAADFELIVPNLTDNGHDGTTQQADAFLRRFVPRITGSPAWRDGGVLFIVWDEGKETGDNHVAALVISPLVSRSFRSGVHHDHYSLLRTIEEAWGLPCLVNACQANTLAEFFR